MSAPRLVFTPCSSSAADAQQKSSMSGGNFPTTPPADGWWNFETFAFGARESPRLYLESQLRSDMQESDIRRQYTHADENSDLAFSHPAPHPAFAFPPHDRQIESPAWCGASTSGIYDAPESLAWPMHGHQPFDAYGWNEMLTYSSFDDAGCSSAAAYGFPETPSFAGLLPCPSPALSSFASSPASSRRSSVDSTVSSCSSSSTFSSASSASSSYSSPSPSPSSSPLLEHKQCSHCAATQTPLWRRNPATHLLLCNACGLYLQQRAKMRPLALILADQPDDPHAEALFSPDAPQCSHCHTRRTSVWRRGKKGEKLCNACGVYARLRGRDRPLALRAKGNGKIRPRCKHPQ
ncbi:hypothetical protein C8J57DRAFT_1195519 [Mycena rebaudengoi]|nr:hypothetical protein C8J57DRAFT_1195519 [Mycena rebaudengoi]